MTILVEDFFKFRQFVDGQNHYWGYNEIGNTDPSTFTPPKYDVKSDKFIGIDSTGVEVYINDIINIPRLGPGIVKEAIGSGPCRDESAHQYFIMRYIDGSKNIFNLFEFNEITKMGTVYENVDLVTPDPELERMEREARDNAIYEFINKYICTQVKE